MINSARGRNKIVAWIEWRGENTHTKIRPRSWSISLVLGSERVLENHDQHFLEEFKDFKRRNVHHYTVGRVKWEMLENTFKLNNDIV